MAETLTPDTYTYTDTDTLMAETLIIDQAVGEAGAPQLASLLAKAGSVDALMNAARAVASLTAEGAVSPRVSLPLPDGGTMNARSFVDGYLQRGKATAKATVRDARSIVRFERTSND